MTVETNLAPLFVEYSRSKLLDQYWPRLRTVVTPLSDEQVWWRPNPASNSIGNLLLHLNGNVYQWLVASFKKLPDDRNRPVEFNERRRLPLREMLANLESTMREASRVFEHLTAADLAATWQIQGYTVTGLAAVYQVVEHFGMHYGQILYVTKAMRGEDFGFYRELDQTGRAS